MKKRHVLLNIMAYASLSLLIAASAYLANVWLLSSTYLQSRFSPTDALFIEGLVLAGFGLLLLLGKGGINILTLKAALLSSTAEALYDEDMPGPQETFRRDKWRPNGFIRIGLVLMLAGVFMILIYFAAS